MPESSNVMKWKPIVEQIGVGESDAMRQAKVGAAIRYHQFVLHSGENSVSPVKMEKMEKETFHLLTEEDRKLLKAAHDALPPHRFLPVRPTPPNQTGRHGRGVGGDLDDLFV